MRWSALDVFACPECLGQLRLRATLQDGQEVIEGCLTCARCDRLYSIVRGVPRFVHAGLYASSFGHQWRWFRTVQLDSANGTEESAKALRGATGWTPENLKGRLVLDAGVGAGRFAECAAASGAEVYGVDLSVAIDAAYLNLRHLPNVHLAQADIFSLPFRPDTFDLAYSIGVLHHTPDPAQAFSHVAITVKPEGQLAVYVYARYDVSNRFADLFRVLTTRLPPTVMLALSSAAVPLYVLYRSPALGRLLRLVAPISMASDWRWRWLDTFDWYTPKYQWKYLYPEVFRWFEASGFRDIAIFDGPIRMRGIKSASAPFHDLEPRRRLVAH